MCYKNHKTLVNPIIDWSNEEVWEFIHEYNILYCSLYDKGYKRLGCIGCPMANNKQELEEYPKYKNLYLLAFQKMLEVRQQNELATNADWACPERVMEWWTREAEKEMTDTEITRLLG